MLDAALELHQRGFNVLPTPPGKKRPVVEWKRWTTERQTERDIRDTFRHAPESCGLWVVLGTAAGVVVLDCDDEAARDWWKARLGDAMEHTARVKTGNGEHFWFRLSPGEPAGNRSSVSVPGSGKWDIRAEGGGVVAPPSVHESGRIYAWMDGHGLDQLQPAPAALLEVARKTSSGPEVGLNGSSAGDGAPSGLADLLAAPPSEGSRNVWLASVAGHHALRVGSYRDYEALVRQAAALLHPPLPEAEVTKLLPSIWTKEGNKRTREDSDREQKIRAEVERLEVRGEARARLAAVEWKAPAVATDAAAVLAQPLPEEQWAVDRLAALGDNVLLAAQYKAGKTTLLLNLLRALADGEPFLGRFAAGSGAPVAWLNYELTDATAHRWLAEVRFQRPERVLIVGLRGRSNPLASRDGQAWLVELLARRGVQFVAVDTFRAAYTGTDHNANAEVARFTALLDRIKQQAGVPGLALSHHFGRKAHEQGQEHGQGAVELDAWADMRWLLTLDGDDRFFSAGGRAEGVTESRLRYDPTARNLWLPSDDVGVSRGAGTARGYVLTALRVESGLGTRQLRERCVEMSKSSLGRGADKTAISAAITQLRDEGRIVARPGPKNSLRHYLTADDPEGVGRLPSEADELPTAPDSEEAPR